MCQKDEQCILLSKNDCGCRMKYRQVYVSIQICTIYNVKNAKKK